MLHKLISNSQSREKIVYLSSNLIGLFTTNHNIGVISDNIYDDLGLAFDNYDKTSYTTLVETDVDTGSKIRRVGGFVLKGNRVSKQIIDGKTYYWYLIIQNESILNKLLLHVH